MNRTTISDRNPLPLAERTQRIALALLLGLGALLMLIASRSSGEDLPFSAKRTDRFNAVLGSRATVHIDNISGDIVASPGRDFSVTVTTSVAATTQKRADDLLARTTISQRSDDEGYSLETLWPDSRSWRDERGRRRASVRIEEARITARYDVSLPAGVAAVLKTVNGEVRVTDVDGELEVSSVNGSVRLAGARRSFQARTVNGRVEAAAAQLPPGTSVECGTVNGAVTLTLPKDAKFDLTASAMSGTIASTFPLPARQDAEAFPVPKEKDKDKDRASRSPRRIVVRDSEDGDIEVDLREVEREIERSMREVERATRDLKVLTLLPGREYSGSIGQGGASVHVSTLNGAINVLAAGTSEAEAKPLVSPRRAFRSITVPSMHVVVPPVHVRVEAPALPPSPPSAPRAAAPPRSPQPSRARSDEETIVLGDVSGDFLSKTPGASYRIGKVSGKVRIVTHGGEIHVESAGGSADLKTNGGDIQIGPVGGELNALTMAGDVRAGAVGGAATAETSGGDIRIDRVGGALEARSAGGDVVVTAIAGAADVETGGGDVRLGFTTRQAAISVRNAGGDVTLTLPRDFRGDFDLLVAGCSPDETSIRSDFPEISVTKRSTTQQGAGSLNGGGAKVVVKTSSGTIRIRKS